MSQVMDRTDLDPLDSVEPAGPPSSPRPRWWPVAALTAALAIPLVVLVIIADHRPPQASHRLVPSQHPDPRQLQFLIGDVPPEFSHAAAAGVERFEVPDFKQRLDPTSFYGSHNDPSAPTIQLMRQDPEAMGLWPYTDLQHFTVAGRAAGCGRVDGFRTAGWGPTMIMCWAQSPRGGYTAHVIGLEIGEAQRLMEAVQYRNGEPEFPSASLPAGMTKLLFHPATGVPTYANATVDYGVVCGTSMTLGISWADEDELAFATPHSPDWKKVQVGSAVGYLSDSPTSTPRSLVWTADGRSFRLELKGRGDLVTLARSVRPATEAEWKALSGPSACG